MGARELASRLGLRPHPEGGFFRETYRAKGRLPDGRCHSTAILFLLPKGCVSRLHRIRSDELWHFYSGGPLKVVELDPRSGETRSTTLGRGKFQHAVKAGIWFGAELARGTDYALVGCTVAPGFEFRDLELGQRAALLRRFPKQRRLLERLLPA